MASLFWDEQKMPWVGKNNKITLLAAHHCQDARYFPSSKFNELFENLLPFDASRVIG
jgi:hypothetical protein